MTELNKRIITSIILIISIFISFSNISILYMLLFIVNFLVIDEFIKIFKKITKKKKIKFITTSNVIIYMVYFSSVIIFFINESFDLNKFKVLFLLLICVSSDIGGFVFGKIIGGKKLTKISPKKTYSGLIGSLLFSILFGYLFYINASNLIPTNLNIFIFIILISLLSQIGDLSISLLKRKAKIKDTGTFLPGHGGILDRVDGILLALPIGILIIH